MTPTLLQSYIAQTWQGTDGGTSLCSAIDGSTIAWTHQGCADVHQALDHARRVGVPALLALDFQQRAERLKALAKFLLAHKASLYELSYHTGATKSDSWIDIEGGTATLFAYASLGSNELPNGNILHEGPAQSLGKTGVFAGTHLLVPREGVAVHINAFNFPVWGLLEKLAPTFLAGMPCLVKPATATSYLTHALVRLMDQSGLLPKGSLQLIIGGVGDLMQGLHESDVVTFTGSADTALQLRQHPHLLRYGIPFNAEADSLNAAILTPEVRIDDPEFDLYVKAVCQEMTIKAGQKCTAIRRALVPRHLIDAVSEALIQRLKRITVGDPRLENVRMGALASRSQQTDVAAKVAQLTHHANLVYGQQDATTWLGDGVMGGAFFNPILLRCDQPHTNDGVHDIEAFGPVCTLMPYDDLDEAVALTARGRGSLVASVVTHDVVAATHLTHKIARLHGRIHLLDRESAPESTGHGSPLPVLKHGGPGRAGGGEELGGLRAVKHYLQRCAIQGSPSMLMAVTREYVRGAKVIESEIHPFRYHFEDLAIGQSLLTHRRTVTEADIVNFGGLSGDYFYMHFDAIAAKASGFGERIAHGYFVLSAAAGLFVSPAQGPVLANYGLESLRFIKPVAIGDTIQARLTAKRKMDRHKVDAQGVGQGVVAWDVQVTNQTGDMVASYEILTLVSKRS